MLKKKKVLIFCFLFILSILFVDTAAAETAQPPEQAIHVFVDSDTSRIYWPMDLPFWVRLATSPVDNAPSFLVQELGANSKMESGEYIKEGIQLEISGRQFVRWYNYVTKDSLLLKFYADDDAPQTSISLFDAPIYQGGQKTFYGKGLKTSLQSEDQISGVETIYYSIDEMLSFPTFANFFSIRKNSTIFVITRLIMLEIPKMCSWKLLRWNYLRRELNSQSKVHLMATCFLLIRSFSSLQLIIYLELKKFSLLSMMVKSRYTKVN